MVVNGGLAMYTDHAQYSDIYKDLYGIRPVSFPENIQEAIEQLQSMLVEEMRAERENQQLSSKAFWDRLKKMCLEHHIDIITAIRWDMQAEDMDDFEHYLWSNDLSWEEIDQCMMSMGFHFTVDNQR